MLGRQARAAYLTFQWNQPEILKNMTRAKAAYISTVWPTTDRGGLMPNHDPH